MKRSLYLFIILFLSAASGYNQIMEVTLPSGRIPFFRKGYLITSKQDTIWSLISFPADTIVFFIPFPARVKESLTNHTKQLPFADAGDPGIRSFMRNGIEYEPCRLGPRARAVYLAVLVRGPLTLYAWYGDFVDHGFYGTMESAEYNSPAGFTTNFHDEYYTEKACYIKKEPGRELVLIPRGEKKFRDAFIPLVKDDPEFI